MAEQQPGSSDQ